MNFLAHAWLARAGSDAFLYGNLIADGVKGSDLSAWPQDVALGIRHHRRVDAFVDAHPTVLSARRRALTRIVVTLVSRSTWYGTISWHASCRCTAANPSWWLAATECYVSGQRRRDWRA